MRGHGEHALALRLTGLKEDVPAGVAGHIGVLVIVQSGAAHMPVFHGKAQRLDQMQAAARIGGQTDDIARVGRDLGRHKNDMKHGALLCSPAFTHAAASAVPEWRIWVKACVPARRR